MTELDYLHMLSKAFETLTPHEMASLLENFLLAHADDEALPEIPVFDKTYGKLPKELQLSKLDFAKEHLKDIGF